MELLLLLVALIALELGTTRWGDHRRPSRRVTR